LLGIKPGIFLFFCYFTSLSQWATAGANPTAAIYSASAVKVYNAMSSLGSAIKNIFSSPFNKCSSLLQRWHCSCKFWVHRIGSSTLAAYFIWPGQDL
jgi:hypothetical protein